MSTPASQALSGASTAPAAASPAPAPTSGTVQPPPAGDVAPNAQPSANAAFYDPWLPASEPTAKEAREWLGAKGFKDPVALVSSYRETERTANELRAAANLKGYPTDKVNADGTITKADDNAMKAWRASMGVPATPTEYKLEVPTNAPFPEFTGYLSEVLHEAGVPAAMAPKLAAGYERAVARLEAEIRAKEDAQSAAQLKQLEQEWGANYQERVALGARGKAWLAKEVGGLNEIQLRTLENVLGTPKFMTAMWKLAAGNKEMTFAGAAGGGAPGFDGGGEALQAEYAQLQADRAAGKIPTEVYRKREAELSNRIAAGFAPIAQT